MNKHKLLISLIQYILSEPMTHREKNNILRVCEKLSLEILEDKEYQEHKAQELPF